MTPSSTSYSFLPTFTLFYSSVSSRLKPSLKLSFSFFVTQAPSLLTGSFQGRCPHELWRALHNRQWERQISAPICDPNSLGFLPSIRCGVIQRSSVMRNTGSKAWQVMMSPFFLSFSLVVLATDGALCVPRRTLDQAGGWWHHYCFIFPLGNTRCLQWHSQHWEHMISLPLGKISLSSDFFFFFFYPQLDQRKDWRKEVPPPPCRLFSLLTPHLLYQ